MIESYRDLDVWQMGIELCACAYQLSSKLPSEERFGLTSQIRRSATSVPANIAEGHARASTKDYARFISIALGSLAELETHVYVAERVAFICAEQKQLLMQQADALGKKLRGLQKSLHNKIDSAVRMGAPAPSPQPRS